MLYYEDPGEKTAVSIDIDRYIEPEGGWDFPGRRFFAERTRQRYFNDDIENVVLQRSFEDPITEGTLDSSSAVHEICCTKYVQSTYNLYYAHFPFQDLKFSSVGQKGRADLELTRTFLCMTLVSAIVPAVHVFYHRAQRTFSVQRVPVSTCYRTLLHKW